MIISLSSAIVMAVLVISFHYFGLIRVARLIRFVEHHFLKNILAVVLIMFLHLLEVAWYALSFYAANHIPGMGHFSEGFQGQPIEYFYFSLSSFTTLGLGEFKPIGGLKVLTAMCSLIGFTMITWSATFYFRIFSDTRPEHE